MKLNILFLTQDDRMVLEFMGHTLEDSLQDTTIGIYDASTHEEAINIIQYNTIDLIIADMDIDTIESYEFYDELHADVKFDSIPFVFLSANEENQEIAILKGISNFFLKPLDVEQLLETLHDILSNINKNNSYLHIEDEYKGNEDLHDILEYTTSIEDLLDDPSKKEQIQELLNKIKEKTNKLMLVDPMDTYTF